MLNYTPMGAGDGGGIRTQFVNGQDVEPSPKDSEPWYSLNIFNNMIVNNVAGHAGGGVSLQDTAKANIINNTIANNDSTATASEAFLPGFTFSEPQPAGIVSYTHSNDLIAAISPKFENFSASQLFNNIIWHNRSFFWDGTGLLSSDPQYADLEVLGIQGKMNPRNCILTNRIGYHGSNIAQDPLFYKEYFNRSRSEILIREPTTFVDSAIAVDEGGNFISIRFGPLTTIFDSNTGELWGDYHIQNDSPAVDEGDNDVVDQFAELDIDYDEQPRPIGPKIDIGADEVTGGEPGDKTGPVTGNISILQNSANLPFVFVNSRIYRMKVSNPRFSNMSNESAGETDHQLSGPTNGVISVTLTVTADDTSTGDSYIAGGEWWEGSDPGKGNGNPMSAEDGAFDSPLEVLTATIDLLGWEPGNYTIFIRSQDVGGNWGDPVSTELVVTQATRPPEAPDWVTATRIDNKTIVIEWADNARTAASYRIERKLGFGHWWPLAFSIPGNKTIFTDGEAPRRLRYRYRIRSQNVAGNSRWRRSNRVNGVRLLSEEKSQKVRKSENRN